MVSPPMSPSPCQNLQGASCILGGHARGQATGNIFNQADIPDLQQKINLSLVPVGKVYLYESSDPLVTVDPTTKPSKIVKIDVTPTLALVLAKVAKKYSLIKSKF